MRRIAVIASLIWVWAISAHAQSAPAPPDSAEHAVASSLYPLIEQNSAGIPRDIFIEGFRKGATDSAAVARARAILIGESVRSLVGKDFASALLGLDPGKVIDILCSYLAGESPAFSQTQAQKYIERAYTGAISAASAAATADPAAERTFMAEASKQPGAVTKPDGVVITTSAEGRGESPGPGSTVVLTYTGSLSDGSVFDSTGSTPAPLAFDSLVQGMKSGLAAMKPGGRATLYIPAHLAYGDEGFPGLIPGGAALRFDIELIEIRNNN